MSHNLDQLEFVKRFDPQGMYDLTVDFPLQVQRAVELSQRAQLSITSKNWTSVVLTGLGGSAAGGDFTRALFEFESQVPFVVNRDYSMPNWANSDTLVFVTSYSGNTEETIASYLDAKSKGCSIIVITSGGKLAEFAKSDGFDLILIPAGQPPRTALGYLFVPVAICCEKLGLLPNHDWNNAVSTLQQVCQDWAIDVSYDVNPTKDLAQKLFGKLSVLYGLGFWQGLVAGRWKGQICENSKNMTFAHTYPELCHNEVLGWVKADHQGVKNWVCIVLQDGSESAKMKKRAEVVAQLISGVAETFTVTARGTNLLERMLTLTVFGDFVSIYLAALNGVDPENIDSINILKRELAQVP